MRALITICIATILFSSCRTQKQYVQNYSQDVSDTTITDSLTWAVPVIQKGDLLSIRVYSLASGVDPKADAPYNLPEQEGGGSGGANTGLRGIQVDQEGNIEYPQLGIIYVEGMTREQLASTIKDRLQDVLKQPTVIVRFLNYKITVLGEVSNPSSFTVPTERVTILDALGLAGDISEFGRKDNVKIVREVNGKIQIGTIDLTSKDMFTSPFFKLQQNDVVMVEQNRRRINQQERQELSQQIGIATSIITAIALILNFIK